MPAPLIIAAGAGGALLWESVSDFIIGEPAATVINVEPGGTVNTSDTINPLPLLLAGGAVLAWLFLRRAN